jgi:hypothetical protein
MDDLGTQIKLFLDDIEFIHLKKEWQERLVNVGIDVAEASVWAAEIGHVIDEYRSSLIRLADLLEETDPERIPLRVHSWAVGRLVVSIPEIEEPMRYLEKQLEKYLPPEPDNENET